MTTLAIVQSCYIPWKGYFDLIRQSDIFILYDCVQYTSHDWRNRNRIKDWSGVHWLTIPVKYTSRSQLICDMAISDDAWREEHWKTIRHAYGKAPCFSDIAPHISELYQSCSANMLGEVNQHFLNGLNKLMNISTPLIMLKKQVISQGDKTDKLIAVCKHYGATRYLSGPSAKAYLDFEKFDKAGIEVEWMRYEYPEYSQQFSPFVHEVSILDLLFNTGHQALDYIRKRAA